MIQYAGSQRLERPPSSVHNSLEFMVTEQFLSPAYEKEANTAHKPWSGPMRTFNSKWDGNLPGTSFSTRLFSQDLRPCIVMVGLSQLCSEYSC